MLAEFFAKLHETAQKSITPVVFKVPGCPNRSFYSKADGSVVEVTHEAPESRISTNSLEAFFQALHVQRPCLGPQGPDRLPRVLALMRAQSPYGSALFVRCETARRGRLIDKVTLGVDVSASASALLALGGKKLTVKEAITKLRFDFLPCADVSALRATLSRVQFRRTSEGRAVTEQARESFGRAVEAEVQGVAPIPESVEARVRWFSTPEFEHIESQMRVEVVTHPEEERIEFAIPEDVKQLAWLVALRKLASTIESRFDEPDSHFGIMVELGESAILTENLDR